MKQTQVPAISSVAKAVESIPPRAWNRLVRSLCGNFDKLVSPITEVTSGTGRLIKCYFDRLLEPQKAIVTQTAAIAVEKVRQSGGTPQGDMKPKILIDYLRASESQTDPTIQELWANLLAQESLHGNVHPAATEILNRMCGADARLLASIAEKNRKEPKHTLMLKLFASTVGIHTDLETDKTSFSHLRLEELNLAARVPGKKIWFVTTEGWLFIKCVTGPAPQTAAGEQTD